jgi:hypothetical protein
VIPHREQIVLKFVVVLVGVLQTLLLEGSVGVVNVLRVAGFNLSMPSAIRSFLALELLYTPNLAGLICGSIFGWKEYRYRRQSAPSASQFVLCWGAEVVDGSWPGRHQGVTSLPCHPYRQVLCLVPLICCRGNTSGDKW